MEYYCDNPSEEDDCGGYCIGRECATCKYNVVIYEDD